MINYTVETESQLIPDFLSLRVGYWFYSKSSNKCLKPVIWRKIDENCAMSLNGNVKNWSSMEQSNSEVIVVEPVGDIRFVIKREIEKELDK